MEQAMQEEKTKICPYYQRGENGFCPGKNRTLFLKGIYRAEKKLEHRWKKR